MSQPFTGAAAPMTREGAIAVLDLMGVKAPELYAVLTVETRGCGFLPDRRPVILFERHIFSQRTGGKFNGSNPDISNPKSGGYGEPLAGQYPRLARAVALDRKAALESASWGIGQVMGFNFKDAGFADAETMVAAFMDSEDNQLMGMASWIKAQGLHKPLQQHDWATFARGYNGKAYAKNKYDTRLAAAFQKGVIGPLPDLTVRAGQIYLTYLGFNPGPVDGLPGKFTFAALNDFQEANGLPETDEFDDAVLDSLRGEVESLT